jgi:hypothetical protein
MNNKNVVKGILILLSLFSFSLTGCFPTFYSANMQTFPQSDSLAKLQADGKYFIVHMPRNEMILSVRENAGLVKLKVGKDSLIGEAVDLSDSHSSALNPSKGLIAVSKINRDSALNEVHLYPSKLNVDDKQVSIALSDLNRIDTYQYDKTATQNKRVIHTLIAITITGGLLLIVGGLVSLGSW